MFRGDYNSERYQKDFDIVIEEKDRAHERGGSMIYGYVPNLPDGFDQLGPTQVSAHLSDFLLEADQGTYMRCYGQALLHSGVEQLVWLESQSE